MQQELCKSKYLALAETYHTKSVHAEWDGKKAEANKYGRLCADEYLKALTHDEFEPEYKVSLYWRAVIQHNEIRRVKTAIDLARQAVELIDSHPSLEKHRVMFEGFLAQ